MILITNAFSLIQTNRLRKKLEPNKLACANLCAYTISGILLLRRLISVLVSGVLLCFSLDIAPLLAVILWVITGWMPSIAVFFPRESMRGIVRFLRLSSCCDTSTGNLQESSGVIIGKRFSATAMGLYSQASKLDRIASHTLPNILVQVMYPVYASVQDDDERLVNMLD